MGGAAACLMLFVTIMSYRAEMNPGHTNSDGNSIDENGMLRENVLAIKNKTVHQLAKTILNEEFGPNCCAVH